MKDQTGRAPKKTRRAEHRAKPDRIGWKKGRETGKSRESVRQSKARKKDTETRKSRTEQGAEEEQRQESAGKEPEKSRTKQGAKEGHRQDGAPGETRQDREPDKTRKRSRS